MADYVIELCTTAKKVARFVEDYTKIRLAAQEMIPAGRNQISLDRAWPVSRPQDDTDVIELEVQGVTIFPDGPGRGRSENLGTAMVNILITDRSSQRAGMKDERTKVTITYGSVYLDGYCTAMRRAITSEFTLYQQSQPLPAPDRPERRKKQYEANIWLCDKEQAQPDKPLSYWQPEYKERRAREGKPLKEYQDVGKIMQSAIAEGKRIDRQAGIHRN